MNITESSHRAGWPDFSVYGSPPPAATLAAWLRETHARTGALFSAIDAARLAVPQSRIVNPPQWEIGHVGWFQEFWVQRRGSQDAPSMLRGADRLYDSAQVPHGTRWSLDLPDIDATRRYCDSVMERSLEALDRAPLTHELAYFTQLSIFHQDMHNEAFCYMWHTLGYPVPDFLAVPAAPGAPAADIEIPARSFMLGAMPGSGFVFDNEKWRHEITLPAYAIAANAVTNAEFLAFVEDAGYRRGDLWSAAGWQMVQELALEAPRYWQCDAGAWKVRRFDRVIALDPLEPVMHVSFHEAEAYCRWTGRRLPTEAEWECAAASGPDEPRKRRYPWGDNTEPPVEAAARRSAWGAHRMSGNLWEWTSSRFAPYPDFIADPYREYSAPWFVDDHRVLRGGSFVTPLRLLRNTWRNFYPPHRADVFCGFRTCAA